MIQKKYKNQIFQSLLASSLGIDNFKLEEFEYSISVIYFPFNELFKFIFYQSEINFNHFNVSAVLNSPQIHVQDLFQF